uniref:UPAR/Ly6 domain-containing protein n=1 Tax=Pelusios castaneus TaxID=367368 RepID=A0A8C8RFK6_9SAUR
MSRGLFAGPSLICYTCQGEMSNKDCMKISICAKRDKYCVTIKDVVGAGMFSLLLFGHESKYRISKMCSPKCPETNMNQGKATAQVFCCDKLLCNVNGASHMKSSYSMISMGLLLANFIYIFRSGL